MASRAKTERIRPLAIFDIDGTLVDSRAMISETMATAFTRFGLTPPDYDATRRIVGLSLMEAIDTLAPRDLDHDGLVKLTALYKDVFIETHNSGRAHEPLYDGAMDLLSSLRGAGWKIGVATGKSRRGLDRVIHSHGFSDYFDAHYCADDGAGKPDPFMVEANLLTLDCAPHHAVMIGDTSFDMIMGKRAGTHALGVSWGFHTVDEITAGGADAVLSTMEALSTSLDRFREGVFHE